MNEEMLSLMKPGSVCVDLAAANGGNVAQTKPDEIVTTSNGVKIIGYTDLPSRLATTASNLFANNYASFMEYINHTGKNMIAGNHKDPTYMIAYQWVLISESLIT